MSATTKNGVVVTVEIEIFASVSEYEIESTDDGVICSADGVTAVSGVVA